MEINDRISSADASPARSGSMDEISADEKTTQSQYMIPDDMEFFNNVEIGMGGSRKLTMHLVKPKLRSSVPLPVLIYIHGGGWNHGTKDDKVNNLVGYVRRGYIGAAIEYRLTHEAIFPAQLEDCKLAVRYLRENASKYNIDPERIGVWGVSAGGHLAALLGTTGGIPELEGNGGSPGYSSRVQAVVDCYGPADFLNEYSNNYSSVTKLLGARALEDKERALRAMPGTYASGDNPPFLIIHGDADPLVPYENSVKLAATLQAAGVDVTLRLVPGAGHGLKGHPQEKEISAMIWNFLDKHLKHK